MGDLALSPRNCRTSARLGTLGIPEPLAELFDLQAYGGGAAALAFERCVMGFALSLQPDGAVEWIMVKDLADLQSDIDRARRAIVVHLSRSKLASIATILSPRAGLDGDELKIPLDPESAGAADPVVAGGLAFVKQSRVIERLEAAVAGAAASRDRLLTEFERRRNSRHAQPHVLRRKIDGIADAVFQPTEGEP